MKDGKKVRVEAQPDQSAGGFSTLNTWLHNLLEDDPHQGHTCRTVDPHEPEGTDGGGYSENRKNGGTVRVAD